MTGTGAAIVAVPGATCGAPKRGWNGGSKPSRPREGPAPDASSRERAKSSRERGASRQCDEHPRARSAKGMLRKACSTALRRSEFLSRASSISPTCSGRQLATAASSRCCGRAPAAPVWPDCGHARSGCPWNGHRPALLRARSSVLQAGSGQRLSRNAPEAGRGESMPKSGKTGLSTVSALFLRPPVRIGKPTGLGRR